MIQRERQKRITFANCDEISYRDLDIESQFINVKMCVYIEIEKD